MQKSPEYADTVGIQEEGTRPDASPAQNELYADFIVKYMGNFQEDLGNVPGLSFQKINSIYGVVYAPLTEVGNLNINTYSYSFIPKCYTYMDLGSLGASGITRLQEHPYLQLKGQGTAIAVIDSGIDYRNPLFQNEMGSRILCIWDQTLDGDGREVPYGKVFWKSDIDRALASENPLDLVPSLDTNGHGTRMAAIAAGNYAPEEGFCGAAPEAMLIIVKVKQAKKYLREFYLFPSQAELFQENDIMMGMDFAVRMANERKLPLSVCLGIGSSQGAHIGKNPLSTYVDYASAYSLISVSVAAGNEGSARHHYTSGCQSGKIRQGQIFAWGTKSLALPWNSGENLRKSTICLCSRQPGKSWISVRHLEMCPRNFPLFLWRQGWRSIMCLLRGRQDIRWCISGLSSLRLVSGGFLSGAGITRM